jgi:hypothetical protein
MARFAIVLFVLSAWATNQAPADPPTIDRSIGKEPVYQTKTPKYCLLAFGPEGKDRVWLVLDGNTLFVDRNGNGDLTEPGKKVVTDRRFGGDPDVDGFAFDVGEVKVGGRTHKGLMVYFSPLQRYAGGSLGSRSDVKAALAKDAKAVAALVRVDVDAPGMRGGGIEGQLSFTAGPIDLDGVFQFADEPAKAPIVRLGGPLQITFYGERPTLRVGRETDLVLVVGTPGEGPGTFAMLSYEGTIPESAKPVAEATLPAAKSGAPPVNEKWTIMGRC